MADRRGSLVVDGSERRTTEQKWTQQQTTRARGVTQAYLSMLEKGRRTMSESFVRKALKVFDLSPTALPLPSETSGAPVSSRKHNFMADLAALGYPRFAYLRTRVQKNPAGVLLDALFERDLDARVSEGLPWLTLTYVDMDWDWLVRNVKVRDRQNRLGFAVSLASDVAESKNDSARARKLRQCWQVLESARLAGEDTFCHDSMTQAERKWLRKHRSPVAAHWNLLTDLKGEHLVYKSP